MGGEGGEVRRRRRWVMLVDATKFKCLMGQTHTHTHTLASRQAATAVFSRFDVPCY